VKQRLLKRSVRS